MLSLYSTKCDAEFETKLAEGTMKITPNEEESGYLIVKLTIGYQKPDLEIGLGIEYLIV